MVSWEKRKPIFCFSFHPRFSTNAILHLYFKPFLENGGLGLLVQYLPCSMTLRLFNDSYLLTESCSSSKSLSYNHSGTVGRSLGVGLHTLLVGAPASVPPWPLKHNQWPREIILLVGHVHWPRPTYIQFLAPYMIPWATQSLDWALSTGPPNKQTTSPKSHQTSLDNKTGTSLETSLEHHWKLETSLENKTNTQHS